MPDQGDLQNWLNQLKKRSAQQGEGRDVPPLAASPVRKQAPAPQPPEEDYTSSLDESISQQAAPVGKSATDIALEKMRKQARLRNLDEKGERQRRAAEVRQRSAKRLEHSRVEVEAARKEAESKITEVADIIRSPLKKRKRSSAPSSSTTGPAMGDEDSMKEAGRALAAGKPLHRMLRHNRTALREAVILSEILGQPLSMRKQKSLWEM